jgi:hypothetical protein
MDIEKTKAEEIAPEPYQPLMPAEIKLIVVSLILGVVLLAFFLWIGNVFFKG